MITVDLAAQGAPLRHRLSLAGAKSRLQSRPSVLIAPQRMLDRILDPGLLEPELAEKIQHVRAIFDRIVPMMIDGVDDHGKQPLAKRLGRARRGAGIAGALAARTGPQRALERDL